MKSWFTHRSVFLAIALFFQAEGMFLVSTVQQFLHRMELEEKMEGMNGHLQLLNLSMRTYQQSRVNRHEISIGQEMYDVKSLDVCGDSVSLLVYRDKKEENLFEKIGEYFRNDHPDHQPNPVSLYQLLSEKYIPPMQSLASSCPVAEKYEFAFIAVIPQSSLPELPAPPPKI